VLIILRLSQNVIYYQIHDNIGYYGQNNIKIRRTTAVNARSKSYYCSRNPNIMTIAYAINFSFGWVKLVLLFSKEEHMNTKPEKNLMCEQNERTIFEASRRIYANNMSVYIECRRR